MRVKSLLPGQAVVLSGLLNFLGVLIGGTMVASGAGLRYGMISRIAIAWVLTLPITILIAGGHYYILTSPKF
jgi:phosphate/sulfate permease